MSEESYKDSTLIMQLLRDNLVCDFASATLAYACANMPMQTLWTSSEAEPPAAAAHAEAPQQEEPKAEAAAEEPKAE